MARYAFFTPIKSGKATNWKHYLDEMKSARNADFKASRAKVGVTEEVWLQHTPSGDFAVVVLEAPDIGKVFQHFFTSDVPFDQWFREKVLVEVHGMDPSAPPPPMNEKIIG
jgi:hypothetical protein